MFLPFLRDCTARLELEKKGILDCLEAGKVTTGTAKSTRSQTRLHGSSEKHKFRSLVRILAL